MIELKRTDHTDKGFVHLVSQLNAYLKVIDGKDHEFYMQYNGIEVLNNVVIAYWDNIPVGCGAFKTYDENSVEIKRMFTQPEFRGKLVATAVLIGLETWAEELGFNSCVLETGKRQIEAVSFYKKNEYQIIPNFGQYKGVENSLCLEKQLNNEKR